MARKRAIPFRPIGALDRDKACCHPSSFFCTGIELGYLFSRFKEKSCDGRSLGVNQYEVPRGLLVLRGCVRTGRLATKALTHAAMLPLQALGINSSRCLIEHQTSR
jgi:hypothetical protein